MDTYLLRSWSQAVLSHVPTFERISNCGTPLGSTVHINTSGDLHHRFGGLESCSSVWSCPRCSYKIGVHRRGELDSLSAYCRSNSYRLALLTLTLRHERTQSLQELLETLLRTWTRFRRSKAWKALNVEGYVRATEVTYGKSGWHPHFHVLLVIPENQTRRSGYISMTNASLLAVWSRSLKREGASCGTAGLDFRVSADTDDAVARYVAKAGLAYELTSGTSKDGRAGNLSPFGLIVESRHSAQASALWIEYCVTMRGRRQLVWSHGLKDTVGITDVTDEDIMAIDDSTTVAHITRDAYQYLRSMNYLGPFIDMLNAGEDIRRVCFQFQITSCRTAQLAAVLQKGHLR